MELLDQKCNQEEPFGVMLPKQSCQSLVFASKQWGTMNMYWGDLYGMEMGLEVVGSTIS